MRSLEDVLAKHPMPFELTQMQKEDTHKLATWARALADLPVGSGKTVVATCAALMLEPDCTVIIVPPVLVLQWVKWLKSLDIGSVLAYEGGPAARRALKVKGARWVVSSFGMFKNDFERLSRDLQDCEALLIVDEAHAIKSHGSTLFKNVRDFAAGRSLLLMTGTPMSKPGDAYSYIRLCSPEVYRSKAVFENIHVLERDFFGTPEVWHNLDLLQSNLSLRRAKRTKEEVHASLPKANYIPTHYALSKEHMALYQRLMEEQLLLLESGGKIDATTASALYHAAQQIVINLDYFADDPEKRSASFDLLDQICDEIAVTKLESSKLIVWTQYKRSSARLLEYLKPLGAVAAYSGADSKKSIAAFLDDPKTRILVANPLSGGAGWNPQAVCWECVFMETPTVTIPFVQAAGRIDRFGQKYNPNIRIAIATNTVQEQLHRNLMENDELVRKASGSLAGIKALIFNR